MSFKADLSAYVKANPTLGKIQQRQIQQAAAMYDSTEDAAIAKNALGIALQAKIFPEEGVAEVKSLDKKARGGPVKKKMMGGSVKKYARGGGMRKARTYG